MGLPIDNIGYYRLQYPEGTKLRITKPIDDLYTPKKVGDVFIVSYIDDAGQIHGSWASGGSMAIIIGVDEFEVYTEEG